MRVKICGVNSAAAFDAAADAGADYIGFVFFNRSPRGISPATAAGLSSRLAGGPHRIGLFVDPSDDDIARALDALPLHALQLYVTADRLTAIHASFAVPVWQAVGMDTRADLPSQTGAAAALVVEARPPAGADRPGGLGRTLDWTMLQGWKPDIPWLLAGGLTPDTVQRAVAASGASGVDVSSGVESAPGIKDAALIHAFVAAAHAPA